MVYFHISDSEIPKKVLILDITMQIFRYTITITSISWYRKAWKKAEKQLQK